MDSKVKGLLLKLSSSSLFNKNNYNIKTIYFDIIYNILLIFTSLFIFIE